MTPLAALSFEQTALLLSWGAIVLLGFAMSGLLRQVHALSEVVQGRRPPRAGPSSGMTVPVIGELNGATRSLLLFADTGCGACEQALERLAAAADGAPPEVAHAVLYRSEAPGAELPRAVTGVARAGRVFDALGVHATPTIVAVDDRHQVVASALVGSPELLDEFLRQVDTGGQR